MRKMNYKNEKKHFGLSLLLLFSILFCFNINTYSKDIDDTKQSKIKITGIVYDKETKDELIGVAVRVKGLDIATITDVDGKFKIEVPYSEASLVFSYIGFRPEEVALKGNKEVTIYLTEDSKALEEVVVVGYRTQKKESITGAVATITTKDLVQSPTANINNALAGRLPGLIVNQHAGGEPGVDKADVYIRGQATYGDRSPIVIVDGIERDMSYLAADEIETFTILKDAASTAPYGIRGANGVIAITTKRGQAQEKATVNFKASVGFNSPIKTPNLLGSADYATLYNEALINDAMRDGSDVAKLKLFSQETIDNFRRAKGDNSDGLGYDWDYFDYLFKTATQQNYNLSVRGGTDRARYYVMAGYADQGSNYKHTDLSEYGTTAKFKKYNFRSNIDIDITKKFWLKLDLGARITDRSAPGTDAKRLVRTALTQPPHLPMTVEPNDNPDNQDFILKNEKGMLYGDQMYRFNMLGELTRTGYHSQKFTSMEGSISAGYDLDFILDGLKVAGTFSYDSRAEQWIRREVPTYKVGYAEYPGYATFTPFAGRDVYMTPGHYDGVYKIGNKYDMDEPLGKNKLEQKEPINRTYYQMKLTYDKTFAKLHEVSSMLLFNRSTQGAYTIDIGKNVSEADVDFRYQGMTGQFTYAYDKRYLAEFNFGYNGSENFERGRRFGFFPAAAAGWVISSEKFMNATRSWLDHLKVRGSYGEVGSDKLPKNQRFGYMHVFGQGAGYNFGWNDFGIGNSGLAEGRLSNTLMTWEKAKKTNIGVDGSLFRQRLNFAFDVFFETRSDILTDLDSDFNLGLPAIVGKPSPLMNIGKVKNKGVEFEVSWSDKIGKDFRYFIKPNFTFARNKVVYLREVERQYERRAIEGKRLDQQFLYVFDHFVQDQAEADRLNTMNNGKGYQPWGKLIPGDVVYKDLDGDGYISDANDKMAMGYARTPEIQFGLPITLQYKGFDFSLLFQGATNTSLMLKDAAAWDFPQFDQDKTGKVRPMHLDRWTPETAGSAKYPALHMGQHSNNKNPESSLFMYDASYIRLKNVEIGYTLPRKIIRIAGLSQVRVYAQGQNLKTWDKLGDLDIDPETKSGGGDWYPILKVFNFGIDVTF